VQCMHCIACSWMGHWGSKREGPSSRHLRHVGQGVARGGDTAADSDFLSVLTFLGEGLLCLCPGQAAMARVVLSTLGERTQHT
jgi:hypothetical protein